MASMELRQIRKNFGAVEVINGVSLAVSEGEFVALVGPSGCGKSTILRMIAGLEEISGGEITIGQTVVNDMTPRERNIAMVFQSLRALSAHERRQEHELQSRAVAQAEGRDRGPRRGSGADAAAGGAARPQAEPIVWRPAPARRHGPRHRARPLGVPVRRAAVEPRRQAARADARRNQDLAQEGRHDLDLRHARSGRGDDAGRPRRGAEPRRHPAGRHADAALPPAGEPVRRRLHRLAGDELPRGPTGARRGGAGRRGRAPGRSSRFQPDRRRARGKRSPSACAPSICCSTDPAAR